MRLKLTRLSSLVKVLVLCGMQQPSFTIYIPVLEIISFKVGVTVV